MNSNNENETQNVNIVQNENLNHQNHKKNKKKKKNQKTKIYPTFIVLLIINLSSYLYRQYNTIRLTSLSISLYPVLYKFQFYRFIIHHFIHYNIFHLLIEILVTYYICKNLEKMIGTLLSFSLILVLIFSTSFLFFLSMIIIKFVINIFNFSYNCDFVYECGMSCLLFSLYSYLIDFKKNKNKLIKLLNFIAIRSRFSSIYFIIFLYFFTPNKSIYGNLCGIISINLIKFLFGNKFFPKYEGICDFEEYFKLNNYKCCYISIIEPSQDMIGYLIEIFPNIEPNSLLSKKDDLGIQLTDIDNSRYNNII